MVLASWSGFARLFLVRFLLVTSQRDLRALSPLNAAPVPGAPFPGPEIATAREPCFRDRGILRRDALLSGNRARRCSPGI